MRCSFVGISALPKFGSDFLERDRCEPADCVRCQTAALIDVLPVPATRELLHDPRCLPAMAVECLVELRSRSVVSEAFTRADVVGQFATEEIVEGSLRQASKELSRQAG